MNKDFDKKNVIKKKNRRSSTYELEVYFKNNIKNKKNSKNNPKKYKNNKNNTTQITKIIVNDEMLPETSIKKDNEPLFEQEILVKKKKMLFFKSFNKKENNKDKQKVINSNGIKINEDNDITYDNSIIKNNESQVNDTSLVKKKHFFVFNLFEKRKECKYKRKQNKRDKAKNKITDNNLNQDKAIKNDNQIVEHQKAQKEKIEATETLKEINKINKKKRIKKYLKEALLFIIIMLLIDVILYFVTDYISILCLFDVECLNIIVTILITVLLLFICAFLLDYLISELLIELKNRKIQKKESRKDRKIKVTNKKRGGDSYRNSRIKQEKRRANCKAKE